MSRLPSASAARSDGVSTKLGGTALTVIPFGPSSSASERVKAITAPFVAA